MKIAIALFDKRVSPRFDYARCFQVIEVAEGRVVDRFTLDTAGWSVPDRIRRLNDLDVKVLICGGIDRFSACMLAERGIELYAWVAGWAEDALQAWLAGTLEREVPVGGIGGRRRGHGYGLRRCGFGQRGGHRGRRGRRGEHG